MEFLKEYWPLLVCVVLIIVAVVLLFVFRDKNETMVDTTAKNTDEQKDNGNVVDTKTEPVKKEKTNKKSEQLEDDTNQEESKTEVSKEVDENEMKETKTEEKSEEAEMEKKEISQKYMVTYDKEAKQWVVKKTGATRASKRCKTKKEAMEVAEKLAESQDLNLTVKKKDGKFQKRENASK